MRIREFFSKNKIGITGWRPSQGEVIRHCILPVARALNPGFVDHLRADGSGLFRIEGWSREEIPADRYPQLLLSGTPLPLLQHFRFSRADVAPASKSSLVQTGVAWEYLLREAAPAGLTLELRLPETEPLSIGLNFAITPPHYDTLFYSDIVWHRGHIYGSGPPNGTVHPEVLELAMRLPGPVLDFGCGRGTLVAELTARGIKASGLELDSPILREAITPELSNKITLYDGSLPAPFADASFQSVVCSEVLEHIPDYKAAVADIARITREQALFTVPDASAIPIGHRHGLVPWHLLEGSHLNFFSQASLEATLGPYFKHIQFGRAGISQINDASFYVSLTAHCWK